MHCLYILVLSHVQTTEKYRHYMKHRKAVNIGLEQLVSCQKSDFDNELIIFSNS